MNPAEDDEPTSDLRATLHSRHQQLQAAGPGHWPEDLVTETLNDTIALLNLQQQLAAQAAERSRTASARVVRTVTQAGSALLAIEAITAMAGPLALGWLTAFGLLLMGTLSIWGAAKNQPAQAQRSRLTAAILLDIAAVWTGVVAGAGVGVEWALPAAGLALAAVFAVLVSAQPAANRTVQGEGR